MAARKAKAPRERRVALAPELVVANARAILASLSPPGGPVTLVIDASPVRKVDAAGLQLLAACAAQWRAQGRAWRWERPAEALRAAARLAALEETLGLS